MDWIDFRSDTVTKPTPGMLEAMAKAATGDDVFGEDPSVNELEHQLSSRFGMEAGLFCPSGTMANQIAIKLHTQPGSEVICDELSHVYQYEGGGIAFNSGASVRLLRGDRGRVKDWQVRDAINPNDIHKAQSKLVVLENTCNRGGGSVYELVDIEDIKSVCLENKLKLHLDGARLFNALVATHQSPIAYGELFDSISICLSKGLGAPVGSVLLGTSKDIQLARRIRKVLGGGMRQAGILAGAGLYALDHHIGRLAEDHAHATELAKTLRGLSFVEQVLPVETNIVLFNLHHNFSAASFVEQLREYRILCFATGKHQIRFVTHLDISPQQVKQAQTILQNLTIKPS